LAWLFQGFFLLVSFPVFFFGGGLWMALISVTQNVVGIGLAFVLIRRFPEAAVFGAAWALVANYLVGFLVGAWAGHKLYPLPWELGRIVRAVACGAVLAAADYYWLTGQRLLWSIPLKTLLCLLLIPMLLLVRAVTMAELRRAGTLAKNKLRGVIGA
jgi:hypothetical protein